MSPSKKGHSFYVLQTKKRINYDLLTIDVIVFAWVVYDDGVRRRSHSKFDTVFGSDNNSHFRFQTFR